MEKIKQTRLRKIKGKKPENYLIPLFIYKDDSIVLKKLLKKTEHIPFIKEIIHFLFIHYDDDIPEIVIWFTNKKFSTGYRASVLRYLEYYDCSNYLSSILKLFLYDSYNVTWYCFDILLKYLKGMNIGELEKFELKIKRHIINEPKFQKKEYHNLLLVKIRKEINKKQRL